VSAVRLWALRDIRRRWRSLVVLALFAAVGGGLAMAAASGALRSRTVISDVMEEHRQPDAMSKPSRPGVDWSEVIELPYVTAWALYGNTALCISENGGVEGFDNPRRLCTAAPLRGGWFDAISRLDVLEGRMAERPNEMVVNRQAAERYGFEVGEQLHVEGIAKHRPLAVPDSLGPLDDYWNGRPKGKRPWGPTYPVRVTGIYRGEESDRLISGGVEDPRFILPTSFMRAHHDELDYRADITVRLQGGASDVDRFRHDVARIMGPDFPVTDAHDSQERVERSTLMESAALWACALAVAGLTLVLVGQAIARLVQAGNADAERLRALGMSRSQLAGGMAAPGLLVAVTGGLGAATVAIAASPAVPIGLARSFDLDLGIRLDAPVLVVGAAAVMLAGSGIALGVAWLAARRIEHGRAGVRGGHRSSIALARAPVPIGLGASWALGTRGARARPRPDPALVAVLVAVAAVTVAITVRAGIDDALAEPARAGKLWDFVVDTPETRYPDSFFREDPDVVGASRVRSLFVTLGGRVVRGYTTQAVDAPLDFVVVEGRTPEHADEVAIGPATADNLGLEVGDELEGGPSGNHPYEIVGKALLPNLSGREAYDEGAWLTGAGMRRIEPGAPDFDQYFVKLRAGADREAFASRAEQVGGLVDEYQAVEAAGRLNLRNVRGLPLLLVAFFGLLGVGTVAHALVTTARRRRRELAMLRAIGMSAGQARGVVAAHATALAVVGVVVGVPLGVLTGQLAWRWVASEMPLVYVAPLPLAAIVGAAVVTVALFNLVALLPARAAVRTPPAATLRTE
jgi:FtsX-like permease family protein/MacB-like protein